MTDGALLTGTAGWLFLVFAALALGSAISVIVASRTAASTIDPTNAARAVSLKAPSGTAATTVP